MIESLTVEGFGPFQRATVLPFAPPRPGSDGQALALVGGPGKTSLLRALALALCPPDVGRAYPSFGLRLIHRSAAQATARVVFASEGREVVAAQVCLKRDTTRAGAEYVAASSANASIDRDEAFVVGYGANRAAALGRGLTATESVGTSRGGLLSGYPWGRVGSLLGGDSTPHPGGLLLGLRRVSDLSPKGRASSDPRALAQGESFAAVTALLSAVIGEEVAADATEVTVGGEPLRELGAGVTSLLAWTCHMVVQWLDREWRAGRFVLDGLGAQVRGFCFVDAVDEALPPLAQASLLERLLGAFPNLTFAVSAYGPMTVCPLRAREIVALAPGPGGPSVSVPPGTPALKTGSEILERWFGVTDAYPLPLGRMFQRALFIAGDPGRSDADDGWLAGAIDEMRAYGVELGCAVEPRAGAAPGGRDAA